MDLHPQGIKGPWQSGIVLDWHTVSSECIGENEFGYPIFETVRSEIGELLYQFKYQGDKRALEQLTAVAAKYLEKVSDKFDILVPVPASNIGKTITRDIATGIAGHLRLPISENALVKTHATHELKSVQDPEKRKELLFGSMRVDSGQIKGRSVLLVDDLYRSGATMIAATNIVLEQGGAKSIYVFATTRTRVHR